MLKSNNEENVQLWKIHLLSFPQFLRTHRVSTLQSDRVPRGSSIPLKPDSILFASIYPPHKLNLLLILRNNLQKHTHFGYLTLGANVHTPLPQLSQRIPLYPHFFISFQIPVCPVINRPSSRHFSFYFCHFLKYIYKFSVVSFN